MGADARLQAARDQEHPQEHPTSARELAVGQDLLDP
jgi:hypothetical protein